MIGFALLAAYEMHVILFACVVVLGVGHIGIHWRHTAITPGAARDRFGGR